MHEDLFKRIIRAKELIDDCCTEAVDINRLAKESFYSPFHFIRTFKNIYRITPHQYLTSRRIDKAKELLPLDGSTVTKVCYDLGFQSLGSFSSLFLRHTGKSPAAYRDEKRRKIILSINFPEKFIPYCAISMFMPRS